MQVLRAAKGKRASALGFLMKGKLKRWHGAQRADLREEWSDPTYNLFRTPYGDSVRQMMALPSLYGVGVGSWGRRGD